MRHNAANNENCTHFTNNNVPAYFLMELPSLLIKVIKKYKRVMLVMSVK